MISVTIHGQSHGRQGRLRMLRAMLSWIPIRTVLCFSWLTLVLVVILSVRRKSPTGVFRLRDYTVGLIFAGYSCVVALVLICFPAEERDYLWVLHFYYMPFPPGLPDSVPGFTALIDGVFFLLYTSVNGLFGAFCSRILAESVALRTPIRSIPVMILLIAKFFSETSILALFLSPDRPV